MPPSKEAPMHKLIAYIDEDVWQATKAQAKVEDRSATAVVRRALARYLESEGALPDGSAG